MQGASWKEYPGTINILISTTKIGNMGAGFFESILSLRFKHGIANQLNERGSKIP